MQGFIVLWHFRLGFVTVSVTAAPTTNETKLASIQQLPDSSLSRPVLAYLDRDTGSRTVVGCAPTPPS